MANNVIMRETGPRVWVDGDRLSMVLPTLLVTGWLGWDGIYSHSALARDLAYRYSTQLGIVWYHAPVGICCIVAQCNAGTFLAQHFATKHYNGWGGPNVGTFTLPHIEAL